MSSPERTAFLWEVSVLLTGSGVNLCSATIQIVVIRNQNMCVQDQIEFVLRRGNAFLEFFLRSLLIASYV